MSTNATIMDARYDRSGGTWPTKKAKERNRRRNNRDRQTKRKAQKREFGVTPPPAWIRPRRDGEVRRSWQAAPE